MENMDTEWKSARSIAIGNKVVYVDRLATVHDITKGPDETLYFTLRHNGSPLATIIAKADGLVCVPLSTPGELSGFIDAFNAANPNVNRT